MVSENQMVCEFHVYKNTVYLLFMEKSTFSANETFSQAFFKIISKIIINKHKNKIYYSNCTMKILVSGFK